jgi:hypothetical protein
MERSSPGPVDERDVLDAERLVMGAAVHAGPSLPGPVTSVLSRGTQNGVNGVKECRIALELRILMQVSAHLSGERRLQLL